MEDGYIHYFISLYIGQGQHQKKEVRGTNPAARRG